MPPMSRFGVPPSGAGPGSLTAASSAQRSTRRVDSLATWHRFPTVTARIAIRYRKPRSINRPLQVSARVSSERSRRIEISAELRDGDDLLADADGTFLHVPLEHFLATPEDALPAKHGPSGSDATQAQARKILQTTRTGDFRSDGRGDAVSRSLCGGDRNPAPRSPPMSRIVLAAAMIASVSPSPGTRMRSTAPACLDRVRR